MCNRRLNEGHETEVWGSGRKMEDEGKQKERGPYSAHLPSGQDNLEGGNCSARHETILYVGERQGRRREEGEGGHGNTRQGGKVHMAFTIM